MFFNHAKFWDQNPTSFARYEKDKFLVISDLSRRSWITVSTTGAHKNKQRSAHLQIERDQQVLEEAMFG